MNDPTKPTNPTTVREWVEVLRPRPCVRYGGNRPGCAKCGRLEFCGKEREGPKPFVRSPLSNGSEHGTPVVAEASHGSENGSQTQFSSASGSETRPRDLKLERDLTLIAAEAGGHMEVNGHGRLVPTDYGLRRFADSRAWSGGVRQDLDFDRESLEEAADLANYQVWKVERVYAAAMAGDPEAVDVYEAGMRRLSSLVSLWRELLTEAA